jgi:hypothetical protein
VTWTPVTNALCSHSNSDAELVMDFNIDVVIRVGHYFLEPKRSPMCCWMGTVAHALYGS